MLSDLFQKYDYHIITEKDKEYADKIIYDGLYKKEINRQPTYFYLFNNRFFEYLFFF